MKITDHYSKAAVTIRLEPIYLCEKLPFTLGNVVKYIMRAPYKGNAFSDYMKAAFYLERFMQGADRPRRYPWLTVRPPEQLQAFRDADDVLALIFTRDSLLGDLDRALKLIRQKAREAGMVGGVQHE